MLFFETLKTCTVVNFQKLAKFDCSAHHCKRYFLSIISKEKVARVFACKKSSTIIGMCVKKENERKKGVREELDINFNNVLFGK